MNGYYELEYREIVGEHDDYISLNRRIWLSWEDLRYQVRVVAQSQAEYHGLLKAKEQLLFRSQLCLPEHLDNSKRREIIEWVLESLDLNNVQDFIVDDLNLFEKRKLAIGLALVGLPRVLLLDEPTDGLDPTRSFELLKSLRRITQQREMSTIITAKQLRQSSIPLIDKILLVAQGATMYYGTIFDAKIYFETRLHIPIPEKGDNPLICMLDAISCADCRRDPSHVENIRKEWESYASDNQVYRTNYPNILIESKQ